MNRLYIRLHRQNTNSWMWATIPCPDAMQNAPNDVLLDYVDVMVSRSWPAWQFYKLQNWPPLYGVSEMARNQGRYGRHTFGGYLADLCDRVGQVTFDFLECVAAVLNWDECKLNEPVPHNVAPAIVKDIQHAIESVDGSFNQQGKDS